MTPPGAVTTCSFNNWWSNGVLQVNTWTDASSYGNTSWVSAGKSTQYNYNWGTSVGSSFFTDDFGAGWNSADYYNQYVGNWSGSSLDTNGFLNQWGGGDSNLNHTILNSVFFWSCSGATCHQEDFWWSSNAYDYSATGWWYVSLFGEYYDAGNWDNAFSNFTSDYGHHSYDWDRYPASTSGAPEPGTYLTLGAGLIALAALRRPWRTRTGLPSRSSKTYAG